MNDYKTIAQRHGVETDIEIACHGSALCITLTRPQALNALNVDMCRVIHAALRASATDHHISHVIMDAAPGRAFCAGGDVKSVYHARQNGTLDYQFFHDEYRMNAAIGLYPKPFIALIDGIVMGGGVGISAHGSHRIVTENARFAMPETGIGLFPDVGSSHVLPHFPDRLGWFLGLTGVVVEAADCIRTGFATHFVDSQKLDDLRAALKQTDNAPSAIASFSSQCPHDSVLDQLAPLINAIFADGPVINMLANLKAEQGTHDLLGKAYHRMRAGSPSSLAVTAEQLRRGAKMEKLTDCLTMEYRIVSHILGGNDLYEGISAALINRGAKPQWSPANLEAIASDDITRHFEAGPFGELELANL